MANTSNTQASALTAVIYLRLSDARTTNDTFDDREAELRQHAARLGWRVGTVVTENDLNPLTGKRKSASAWKKKTVTVIGEDGKPRKRRRNILPGFERMLSLIDDGSHNALLAENLDRVTRDNLNGERLLETFEDRGAYADSLTGMLKLTAGGTFQERKAFRDHLNHASASSAETAWRVKLGRARSANAGRYHGGPRPFGWESDGVTLIGEEADVIRQAAHDVLHGASLRGIARDLNARGVSTATGVPWSPEIVRDILLRQRNAGRSVYKGEVRNERAAWGVIVEPGTHDAVVAKLTDPARATQSGRAPRWLGSGIYRHGSDDCDGTVEITIGGRAPRYRCRACSKLSRKQADVDGLVVATVLEYVRRERRLWQAQSDAEAIDLAALATERQKILTRLEALTLPDDEEDDPQAAMLYAQLLRRESKKASKRLSEIAALELKARGTNPHLAKLADCPSLDDAFEVWQSLTLEQQRMIIAETVTVDLLPIPAGKRMRTFDPASVRIEPRR